MHRQLICTCCASTETNVFKTGILFIMKYIPTSSSCAFHLFGWLKVSAVMKNNEQPRNVSVMLFVLSKTWAHLFCVVKELYRKYKILVITTNKVCFSYTVSLQLVCVNLPQQPRQVRSNCAAFFILFIYLFFTFCKDVLSLKVQNALRQHVEETQDASVSNLCCSFLPAS